MTTSPRFKKLAKINGVLFILLFQFVGGVYCNQAGVENKTMTENLRKATFAGGCFWCMQSEFDHEEGIIGTSVGYTGGKEENPSYEDVSSGKTGHAEAIEIVFDPEKISYERLLKIFWRNIDPTTLDQQFADIGSQYRTAIFYHDDEQKKQAIESKEALAKTGKFKKPLVTEVVPAGKFYVAEEYHQRYYKKNPMQYKMYKIGSGREAYVKGMWGSEKE